MKKISFSVELLVALAQLEDKDLAQVHRAIIEYANEGTVPNFSNAALKAFFSLFRSSIDEQIASSEKQSQTNRENATCKNSSNKKKSSKKSASLANSAKNSESVANSNANAIVSCKMLENVANGNANAMVASEMHEASKEPLISDENSFVNNSVDYSVNESDSLQIASYSSNSQQVADDGLSVSKSLNLEDIETVYPKLGSFRSESLTLWSKLSDSDRKAAIDFVPEYLISHPSSSSQAYLNQYLKMEPWSNKM